MVMKMMVCMPAFKMVGLYILHKHLLLLKIKFIIIEA